VRGRPTLVQNVETLAHMALIARYGPDWFRAVGTTEHPGSTLLTVSGAVAAPGVFEIEHGMALGELLSLARAQAPAGLLVGGYFGTWLPAEAARDVRLANPDLARHGAALGAGVIFALPREACPVAEAARVAAFFSAESAGQCGPCVYGLEAIALTVERIAAGASSHSDLVHLERWCGELPGRGACHHPDGAVRFLSSAMRVFAEDFRDHARHGPCARCAHPPVLPVPSGRRLALAA
jgi:NADH:ubiquinone oxidoreductase subunit F (NADH-binding)